MTKQVQPVEKMLAKMRTDYKTSSTSGKKKLKRCNYLFIIF